jgi:hypothetical protein
VNRLSIISVLLAFGPFLTASSCETLKEQAEIALHGASAQASASAKTGLDVTKSAFPEQDLQPYGVDGSMNGADTKALLHLAWPQSYDAIIDRFGFPAYRNATQDFYQLSNGRWVAVNYSGRTAVGYSLSDSQ